MKCTIEGPFINCLRTLVLLDTCADLTGYNRFSTEKIALPERRFPFALHFYVNTLHVKKDFFFVRSSNPDSRI